MKNLIKSIFIILLLILFTFVLMGERIGVLEKIYNPQCLVVSKGKVYIAQKSTFYVFVLDGLKPITQFCKQGEGPGEMQSVPMIPNTLIELDMAFIAESMNKIIQYSKEDLKIVIEKNKGGMVWNFLPIGDNFVCTKIVLNKGDKVDIKMVLIDKDLKELKVLHHQSTIDRDKEIIMLRDPIGYGLMKGKIYVEKSNIGFVIDIYDQNGTFIKRIEDKNYSSLPVTDQFKTEIMEDLKNDQLIMTMAKGRGGWEKFKKEATFTFPKKLPVIRNLKVKNERIFIMTYTGNSKISRLIVMDEDGKVLKTREVPFTPSPFFTANAFGKNIYLWDVDGGFYYYLDMDEDEEEWFLGKVAI